MSPPSYHVPSAPSYEDLHHLAPPDDSGMSMMNVMPPPPMDGDFMAPPPFPDYARPPPPPSEEDNDLGLVLDGMSPSERQAMMDEQAKIMASFEAKKSGSAHTSEFSSKTKKIQVGPNESLDLHGKEKTEEAIRRGRALTVNCVACESRVQVTSSASLMLCPVCETVSPVEGGGGNKSNEKEVYAGTKMEDSIKTHAESDSSQMLSDAELAKKLQKEEYNQAEREKTSSKTSDKPKASTTWGSWFGSGSSSKKVKEKAPPTPPVPRQGALVSATTGEESVSRSSQSYKDDEPEQKSTSWFSSSSNRREDDSDEGADDSGIVAVPNIGRNRN